MFIKRAPLNYPHPMEWHGASASYGLHFTKIIAKTASKRIYPEADMHLCKVRFIIPYRISLYLKKGRELWTGLYCHIKIAIFEWTIFFAFESKAKYIIFSICTLHT